MTGGNGSRGAGGTRAQSGISGAEFAGVGIQFAATIVIFAFAGVWLDRRLGTTPWLLLLCVLVGAGGGFFSMYRKVIAAQRRDAQHKADLKADQAAHRGTEQR